MEESPQDKPAQGHLDNGLFCFIIFWVAKFQKGRQQLHPAQGLCALTQGKNSAQSLVVMIRALYILWLSDLL